MTNQWRWESGGKIEAQTLEAFFSFWLSARATKFGDVSRTLLIDVKAAKAFRGDAPEINEAIAYMLANPTAAESSFLIDVKRLYQEPYIKADKWLLARIREALDERQPFGRIYYWAWENYMSGFWCESSQDAVLLKFGLDRYNNEDRPKLKRKSRKQETE